MKIGLGEILKSGRVAAGINQSEMARKIGCTPPYIWHIEHDLCVPNSKLLRKFTKAANINPKQLRADLTKVVNDRLKEMGI